MSNKIKDSLLDITPDLKESKSRVKNAVLHTNLRPRKRQLLPQIILGCFIAMSVFLVSMAFQTDTYISGFSEKTLNMYNLLDDNDPNEAYQNDLITIKYGKLMGVKLNQQQVKELVASYKSELPHNFNKVLDINGISPSAYQKHYLTLKAQVQLVQDSLLPNYEKLYPQFHQEIHAQLLLLDAIKETNQGNMSFGNQDNLSAIVIYEGENARILSLIEEKRLLEEQLIIMPIRDSLNLKAGEEVILENSFITSVIRPESKIKNFVVSQNTKVITENRTKEISAKQKELNLFFEQNDSQTLSQTENPDFQLKTLNGDYSIWFNDDIIIGSGDKGFIISKEQLQAWGEELINN